MGITKELAAFTANLSFRDLPDPVVGKAAECLLDYTGCALFATQTEMGKIITAYAGENNSGRSTILPGMRPAYSPAMAALANGCLGHGFELDDVVPLAILHPGCMVIPAAVALGEDVGSSGEKLVEAIAVGYEIGSRAGAGIVGPSIAWGFHPTGTFGVFAALAAACKILGLNAGQIESAFGLAGSFASGITQFGIGGSMVKRLHGGKSAQQGVMLAQLAARGFTGPADIFEGERGFCRTFCGGDTSAIKWDVMTRGLGKDFMLSATAFKPSPACNLLHAVIDNLKAIMSDPRYKFEDIEEIVVGGNEHLVHEHNFYDPASIMTAQYSLPFIVGLTLTGDEQDARQYLSEDILRNRAILDAGRKVRTVMDDDVQALYPEFFGARTRVFLKDGTVLEAYAKSPRGSSDNPMTWDDLREKYDKLTRGVISEEAAAALAGRIRNITALGDVRGLFVPES